MARTSKKPTKAASRRGTSRGANKAAPRTPRGTAKSAAAPAQARIPFIPDSPGPRSPVPANCTITVAFGSFGPGIDGVTLERMERRLRTDRRVRTVTRHRWGREGEVTLCVHLVRLADVYRVGRDLNAMVPARPRGPVQVQYPRRMPPPR